MRDVGLDLSFLARAEELGLTLKQMVDLECIRLDIYGEYASSIEYLKSICRFEALNPKPYLFHYLKIATHGLNGDHNHFDEEGFYK